MNLLLLGHIFQQKFPERTVQSGEKGKEKKKIQVNLNTTSNIYREAL